LLAFSRKQILEMSPVIVDSLVNNLAKILRRLVMENIIIEFKLQAQHQRVMADPTQLEQVLMNLVVNARDAMPHGGCITIATSLAELNAQSSGQLGNLPPGEYVRLTIQDTGSGIPPVIRSKVFEPFFTTKERGKGTGLGLATVFGIISQHNGGIICRSAVGVGSVFNIYLPIVTHQMAGNDSADAGELLRGSETILLVEDDSLSSPILQQALISVGYKVLLASNGTEAMQLLESHGEGIDLLLADVVLPDLDGPELAVQIRKKEPGIKLLFISGYSNERVASHDILKPGVNFFSKPISLIKLSKIIRKVLDDHICK